jgi:perosamine synthetase
MTAPESRIPLAGHEIRDEDVEAVVAVLRSDRLSIGPQVRAFEEELADYVGVKHAVAVNSGTSALHLIVRALEIGEGDEVITTPFSFVASTNCVLFERARPVFVDIERRTLCIDPERIEAAITKRTRAILAVDVFGHPAAWPALERIAERDWPALEAVAGRHGVDVIDDSAEALGSDLDGRRCGSFGWAGVFGFYPNKQITTGEGGMVVTNDPDVAVLCRSMADQGRGDDGWLHHVRLGYNYRLDEMSAALGRSQLRRIEEIVEDRARVAGWYAQELADLDAVILPRVADRVKMSWFVFVVQLASDFDRADRDRVLRSLRDEGIGCRDYFQPIHLQPFIREALGTKPGDFPNTEYAGDRSIALPFFNRLSHEQVKVVAEALRRAVGRG